MPKTCGFRVSDENSFCPLLNLLQQESFISSLERARAPSCTRDDSAVNRRGKRCLLLFYSLYSTVFSREKNPTSHLLRFLPCCCIEPRPDIAASSARGLEAGAAGGAAAEATEAATGGGGGRLGGGGGNSCWATAAFRARRHAAAGGRCRPPPSPSSSLSSSSSSLSSSSSSSSSPSSSMNRGPAPIRAWSARAR